MRSPTGELHATSCRHHHSELVLPHRPLALATALALTTILLAPVSAAATDGSSTVTFSPPAGLRFIEFVDNNHAVYAITDEGVLYAWGENLSRSLGVGTATTVTRPTAVTGSVAAASIARVELDERTAYAVDDDGIVHAWGLNPSGQVGDGSRERRDVPAPIAGALAGVTVDRVVADSGSAFAIAADGSLFAWGDNALGQLGTGGTDDVLEPTELELDEAWGGVVDLAFAFDRALAVTDAGVLLAWGVNEGLLGDGGTETAVTPTAIMRLPSGDGQIQLEQARTHSVVLAPDGTVVSWGVGEQGQLGQGDTTVAREPSVVHFPPATVVSRLVAPYALTTDGQIFGWGPNPNGRLSFYWGGYISTPRTAAGVPSESRIQQVATVMPWSEVRNVETLVLDQHGALYGWGDNQYLQLGNTGWGGHSTAIRIAGLPVDDPVSDVVSIRDAVIATTASGRLYSWGRNYQGMIGQGTKTLIAAPTPIAEVTGPVASLHAGSLRSFAVDAEGRTWGWGIRHVGNGATGPVLRPVVIDAVLDGPPPALAQAPAHTTITPVDSATLTAAATSATDTTVCWQTREGDSWSECREATRTNRAGELTTTTLTLTAGEATQQPTWRARFTSIFGELTTAAATVTVRESAWASTPRPTVSGSRIVGETLTATTPTWSPAATSTRTEWRRGSTVVATGTTYVVRTADVGATLTAVTVGTRAGYPDASAASAALGVRPRGEVSRLAGSDRYATSSAISNATFPPTRGTVFIASGRDFPDALAGAALAGESRYGSPVLLTDPSALPNSVRAELQRLRPQSIVILGGEAAVSSRVQSQLRSYAPAVRRVSGPDRYATAASISSFAFGRGVEVAYIANGANFPDALSGAAAAGHRDSPILLTTHTGLPPATVAELQRLRPKRIVVLGGTGAVSSAVQSQLRQYTSGSVTRLSGSDRYATSAAISAATFPRNVPVAYIADGANFPDALSGAAAGGHLGGPVLLTPRGGLPDSIKKELQRLNPGRIVILGGTGAVSTTVANQLKNL